MIYLLHSTIPLGGTGKHSARHYLGYCPENGLERRLAEHRGGTKGAAITRAYVAQGARLLLVALLPGGTRTTERQLKNMGHFARFCPICSRREIAVGWPNGLIALIPRRKAWMLPSEKQLKGTGGVSPVPKLTPATLPAGVSRLGRHLAVFIPSGGDGWEVAPGGTSSTATAKPSPAASTSCAGTRPASTYAANTNEEGNDADGE